MQKKTLLPADDVVEAIPLTDRENEILDLVRKGMSRTQVGYRLGIAEPTVRTHVQSVFGKLGVRSITGALFVLEQRKKRQLAKDIRAASAHYWASDEVTGPTVEDSITDLLADYIDDEQVSEALREWKDS